MNRLLEIEIGRPGGTGYATVTLPAMPWELRDALDRARITNVRDIYTVEPLNCKLSGLMDAVPASANLYELNHLAQRLSELDDNQLDCFEGMVKMDREKGAGSIPMERLINFTHSMDDCHFISRVYTDAALGKFCVDNGFLVIPENLPEILFEILDYESIGRRTRMAEGGVFTSKGYVVQNGEIVQSYHEGGAVPIQDPSYTILLEVKKGGFNAPAYENELSEFFMLPNDGGLDRVIRQVGASRPEECGFAAADCAAPRLLELISDALHSADGGGYHAVNELAGQLQCVAENGRLVNYKAMLDAAPGDLALEEAIGLSYQTVDFAVDPNISWPEEYARHALAKSGVPLSDELIACVNLHRYGVKLMAHDGVTQSGYGALKPLNGQTVEQRLCRAEPSMTMEMK